MASITNPYAGGQTRNQTATTTETKAATQLPKITLWPIRMSLGEALKVAEKLQGGGHANAAGAILPKSIKNIPDAVEYLRNLLQPKTTAPLNALEGLFAGLEAGKK